MNVGKGATKQKVNLPLEQTKPVQRCNLAILAAVVQRCSGAAVGPRVGAGCAAVQAGKGLAMAWLELGLGQLSIGIHFGIGIGIIWESFAVKRAFNWQMLMGTWRVCSRFLHLVWWRGRQQVLGCSSTKKHTHTYTGYMYVESTLGLSMHFFFRLFF